MPYAMAFLIACTGCSKSGAPPVCPDPADPNVRYFEGTRQDPARCNDIRVVCSQGLAFNYRECGCGCID